MKTREIYERVKYEECFSITSSKIKVWKLKYEVTFNKNFRNCFILENEPSCWKLLIAHVVDTLSCSRLLIHQRRKQQTFDTLSEQAANFLIHQGASQWALGSGSDDFPLSKLSNSKCLSCRCENLHSAGIFAVCAVLRCPGCSNEAAHASCPTLVLLLWPCSLAGSLDSSRRAFTRERPLAPPWIFPIALYKPALDPWWW